jgi:hypothetical protein
MDDSNNILDVLLNGNSIKVEVSITNDSVLKLIIGIVIAIILSTMLTKLM